MCGIVGYVGDRDCADVLVDALSKLEYRGYDSAGIAVVEKGVIKVEKCKGRLANLVDKMAVDGKPQGHCGIGHTRWATHGEPSDINSHPHGNKRVSIVHNGIIENYKQIKDFLIEEGYSFVSETDTETVAKLLDYYYVDDPVDTIIKVLSEIKGSYALGIMFRDYPDTVFAVRKECPLIVGVGENENFLASDVPAIIKYTRDYYLLEANEIAVVKKDSVQIYDMHKEPVHKEINTADWDVDAAEKGGYAHFMLKEIHEQPDVVRNVLSGKLRAMDEPIHLKEVTLDRDKLKNLNRIQIVACGTSLHAAMVGKYIIEDFCGISVDVEPSSEYIYRKTITDQNTLVIGVSQSGETADTITAVRQAKAKGSHILIVTNRPDSTMAREADSLVPVYAGIEVSVAATKSYMAQLISFYLLAIYMAEVKGVNEEELRDLKHELIVLPQKIEKILSHKEDIQKCARAFSSSKDFIFIARGINYPTALEGALKLKEISYINATGYTAGELKHGPIAMLDETMPVLSILMKGKVYDKILSNSEEARARNARMIALTDSDDTKLNELFDYIIRIPEISEILSPALAVVPLQLLAYYIAEFLGKDVDQPRNLAKSVTVE